MEIKHGVTLEHNEDVVMWIALVPPKAHVLGAQSPLVVL
jgi:hypothetical protein